MIWFQVTLNTLFMGHAHFQALEKFPRFMSIHDHQYGTVLTLLSFRIFKVHKSSQSPFGGAGTLLCLRKTFKAYECLWSPFWGAQTLLSLEELLTDSIDISLFLFFPFGVIESDNPVETYHPPVNYATSVSFQLYPLLSGKDVSGRSWKDITGCKASYVGDWPLLEVDHPTSCFRELITHTAILNICYLFIELESSFNFLRCKRQGHDCIETLPSIIIRNAPSGTLGIGK